MTISELLTTIEAANISHDTEIFGPSGPLRCVHLEDGVLVLDETNPVLVQHLSRLVTSEVLWANDEPAAA